MNTQVKLTKISKCYWIMRAFEFLGIPAESFSDLKKQYGGLDRLYMEIENRLGC